MVPVAFKAENTNLNTLGKKMIYLTKDDLIAHCQERFIDESCQGDEGILDTLEITQIGIVRTYIGTRYGVDEIFSDSSPIPNDVLKSIIARLLLYSLIKRNAARKIPTNFAEDFEAAMKELLAISTGKTPLSGLPTPTDSSGNPTNSSSLWGNNTNKDFYI